MFWQNMPMVWHMRIIYSLTRKRGRRRRRRDINGGGRNGLIRCVNGVD